MSLTPAQLRSAVQYNSTNAQQVGWLRRFGQVASLLGFRTAAPGAEQFARAVHSWQLDVGGLTKDGKLGHNTWRKMQPNLPPGGGPAVPDWLAPQSSPLTDQAASEPLRIAGAGPLWLQIAQAELNRWDQAAAAMTAEQQATMEVHMTRDEYYFLASPYFGGQVQQRGTVPRNQRRLDWCAAFVNWCLHRAGYSHSGSAGAHSFLLPRLWRFRALPEPRKGCVVVVGNGNTGAHVAFLWDWDHLPSNPNGHVPIVGHRWLEILGGNQGQRISRKSERRRMLAARGLDGTHSPYLWPERGEGTCNLAPATEFPHFCGNVH